ncbi:hypothetical protein D3C85_1604130 [compost metagenome]
MRGVQPRVVRPFGDFLGLDHTDDLRSAGVRLGVDDVEPRGSQTGHDQIATLDMRMWRIGTKARRAGIPAEMVQLIADIRHVDLSDDLRIARRRRIDIDHSDGIRPRALGIERRDIG